MKERPILFSGPMVRAIRDDRKTQTRRLVKGQALEWIDELEFTPEYVADPGNFFSPFGYKGDRLWVRESLRRRDDDVWVYAADNEPVELAEDDPRVPAMVAWAHHKQGDRCNSIHMHRWASRITLEVLAVRIERLQAISQEDAIAEGFASRGWFSELWDDLNGARAPWSSNPWVWVVEFRRIAP